MRHYLSNIWTNIKSKKQIVYWIQKFGIRSPFISIWFKIDQIVCDRPNIAVTYLFALSVCVRCNFFGREIENENDLFILIKD